MDEPENGEEMEMSKFISKVLQSVVEGVLLAQGASVPCVLPEGVEFVFRMNKKVYVSAGTITYTTDDTIGDVTFTVPLSNIMFDKGTMVTYTHGSIAKN